MKITQKKQKDLTLLLNVEIIPDDYEKKVEEIILDYRKKVVTPGFRKGKTPISFINKKYRVSVLIDEINKIIQEELYKYIEEKKIDILGSPLPEKNTDIDWQNQTTFNFSYQVALAPIFEIPMSKKDLIVYHKIQAEKELVQKYCFEISKRYGEMQSAEESESGDLILCNIQQLNLEGETLHKGIENEGTVSIDFISDKKIKAQFIGIKKDDSLVVDVIKGFQNKSDLAALLNIEQKVLDTIELKDFRFTVKKISRINPAKLDKKLFDKVYGENTVKNEKEFKAKIKEDAEANFIFESDRMFKNDVVEYMLDKTEFDLPDDFLKKWLVQSSEASLTFDKVEGEYPMYSRSLRWQLIENKIIKEYSINITEEEILEHTKNLINSQMAQYGQPKPEAEKLIDIAKNVLKNKDERKKINEQIFDRKTFSVYKENFKIREKNIAYNDFIKLASEKQK
ncbi:MAG: trigger factor [Bacteroidota bacterium]|nr:trigger factor [Bacteroidota bacterium]